MLALSDTFWSSLAAAPVLAGASFLIGYVYGRRRTNQRAPLDVNVRLVDDTPRTPDGP